MITAGARTLAHMKPRVPHPAAAITGACAPLITMQLTAGDLANAGGQDVFVGNYTTNSSNDTCGVGAETSFTVK